MKNKYQEVMRHVSVTDEMRNRILSNVQGAYSYANGRADHQVKDFGNKRKNVFYSLTRYAAVAAVFVLVAASFQLTISDLLFDSSERSTEKQLSINGSHYVETAVEDRQALEKMTHLSLNEPAKISKTAEKAKYSAIDDKIAVVRYLFPMADGIVFMQADSDIELEDYNTKQDYSKSKKIGDSLITLRGKGDHRYNSCIFRNSQYVFSLELNKDMDMEEWLDMLDENFGSEL